MKSKRSISAVNDDGLEHVGPFLFICAAVFALHAIYYAFQAYVVTASICGIAATAAVVFVPFATFQPRQRLLLAHVYMAMAVCSLIVISLTSGQKESYTPVFLCCAGLLAATLMEIRAALIWSCVALVSILFIDASHDPFGVPILQERPLVDQLLNFVALSLVIYFAAQEATRFFKQHSGQLIRLTEELQERTRLLSMAEEVSGVGHWRVVVRDGLITYSEEAVNICGMEVTPDEPQPLATFLNRFPMAQARQLEEAISLIRADADTAFLLDLSFKKGDSQRFVTVRGVCEQDKNGQPTAVFGIIKDDTEAHRAAAQLSEKAAALQKLAAFDVLTGLANRYRFQKELERSIQRASESNTQAALLLIDMDGFKGINDTLGHAIGDEVLRLIANRLQHCAARSDTVARLGGDEFTLILNDVSDATEVHQKATEIAGAISQPYRIADKELSLEASIGVALCPVHSEVMDEVLAYADTAMYEAKSTKQRLVIYDPKMTRALVRRRQLEAELAMALPRNEFHLLYQPQYRIDGKSILGFEALVRWNRKGKTVSPLEFIPVLEQTGAILSVGEWILNEACRQAQRWMAAGHDVTISVNISPIQFRDRKFVSRVIHALDAAGLDPHRLDLEVTESVFIEEVESTAQKLFQLKEMGISISIDDFGTGYSSLAYLKHLPIDRLKIDRAFVKDIPSPDDGTIASSIVGLGHNLEMRVLAEGVETDEQLLFLSEQLCDECQGFLFSQPIAAERCTSLLNTTDPSPHPDPACEFRTSP